MTKRVYVNYEYDEIMAERAAQEAEKERSEDPRGGLFRDPLRGFSIDKFPYSRSDDELRLDFIFKAGAIYGPCLALAAVVESPLFFLFIALWFTVNFIRRNG